MDAKELVESLGGGHFPDDLSFALVEVSERAVITGTKGKVTVVIDVEQMNKGEPMVITAYKITTSLPTPQPKGSAFWAVGSGTLEKQDRRQMTFDVRQAPSEEPRRSLEDEAERIVRGVD